MVEINRRRDVWKDPRYLTVGMVGEVDHDSQTNLLEKINVLLPGNKDDGLSTSALMKSCREYVVYRQDDGLFGASFINLAICSEKRKLAFFNFLDQIDMDEEDLIQSIAMCEIYEVPVVPDTSELIEPLQSAFRELYSHGFSMGEGKKKQHYRLIKSMSEMPLEPNKREVEVPSFVQPALAHASRLKLESIQKDFGFTAEFLSDLTLGLDKLEKALLGTENAENVYQRMLEAYPQVLGLNYESVHSQFGFAEKFRADFALFTPAGSTVFVELESPKHKLFTNKGDPAAPLTHAISQITDWHHWLANNYLYLGDKIPYAESPFSIIVIGRESSINQSARKKLTYMNSVNRHQFKIITYDTLLSDGRHLLSKLTGRERPNIPRLE